MFSQKFEPHDSYKQYSKQDMQSDSEEDCEDVDEMMIISTSKKVRENNPHLESDNNSPVR